MGYLIDTNVLSEMRKGTRAHPRMLAWSSGVRQREMYLSVLVLGEVRCGIEGVRRRDPGQAAGLDAWLRRVRETFGGNVLPVTDEIADAWGRLSVPDRLSEIDGFLAATAIVHDLTLVTRNVRDVARTGVRLVNPFDEPSPSPPES